MFTPWLWYPRKRQGLVRETSLSAPAEQGGLAAVTSNQGDRRQVSIRCLGQDAPEPLCQLPHWRHTVMHYPMEWFIQTLNPKPATLRNDIGKWIVQASIVGALIILIGFWWFLIIVVVLYPQTLFHLLRPLYYSDKP